TKTFVAVCAAAVGGVSTSMLFGLIVTKWSESVGPEGPPTKTFVAVFAAAVGGASAPTPFDRIAAMREMRGSVVTPDPAMSDEVGSIAQAFSK
ncbi:hypothetical protein QUU95_22530, partial [Xanthomonas citri pv. citri]